MLKKPNPDPNPLLAVYKTFTNVPYLLPSQDSDLRSILNFAYGYPDGNCNTVDPVTGQFVGKKKRGEEPELEEAHYNIRRGVYQTVYVSVRKDGTRTLCTELPPGMVKVNRYFWVPRGQKAKIKAMLTPQTVEPKDYLP